MRIKVFKNQLDLKISVTEDKIINIIGLVGSGKSTLADSYKNKPEYKVIVLDSIFFSSNPMLESTDIKNIVEILEKKYGPLIPNKFKDYYHDIVDYLINDSKKRTGVIEGAQIHYFVPISEIKGQLIIKMTSIFNSWKRALKRDIVDKNIKLRNKEITMVQYINKLFWILRRRTKQIMDYKVLNDFIESVDGKEKNNH